MFFPLFRAQIFFGSNRIAKAISALISFRHNDGKDPLSAFLALNFPIVMTFASDEDIDTELCIAQTQLVTGRGKNGRSIQYLALVFGIGLFGAFGGC